MANKKLDDEDDDDDLDDGPAAGDETAAAPSDEDEPVFDDEDDEPKRGKGKLIAIIAVAATLVIAVAGAGAYFFVFSGHDDDETAETASAEKTGADDPTSMTISRNRRVMSAEELAKQGQSSEAGGPPPAAPPAASSGLTPPAPGEAPAAAPAAPAPAPSAEPTPQQQAAAAAPAAPAPAPAAKGAKGKGNATAPAGPVDTQGLVTPAATAAAYRDIPVLPPAKPLSTPDPQYGETVDVGIIPRARGSSGVWKVYGRPFDGAADKPKLAIIITGLGMSRASTLAAISQTPPGVTLAFDPYTRNLDEWLGLGRSNGHEALMQLPMEPSDFPISDPGPLALMTDIDAQQNIQRMYQVFATAIGYTGVIQVMGSKFAASEAAMRPALDEMKKRGVLFVSVPASNEDRGFALAQDMGVPSARVDLKLDSELTGGAIDDKITELERLAREKGRAVGIAEASPIVLARLSIWGQTLSLKEIQLAPASAIVNVAAPAPTKGGEKGAAPKH